MKLNNVITRIFITPLQVLILDASNIEYNIMINKYMLDNYHGRTLRICYEKIVAVHNN